MTEKIDLEKFPLEIRDKLIPDYIGDVVYECIGCGKNLILISFFIPVRNVKACSGLMTGILIL